MCFRRHGITGFESHVCKKKRKKNIVSGILFLKKYECIPSELKVVCLPTASFGPVSLRHANDIVRPTARKRGRRSSAVDALVVAGVRTSDFGCVWMVGDRLQKLHRIKTNLLLHVAIFRGLIDETHAR